MKRVSIWKKSFETAKAVSSPALYLSLLGIAIPLVAFQLGMAFSSLQITEITELLTPSHQTVVSFSELLWRLSTYTLKYVGWLMVTVFLSLASYTGVVFLCTQYLRGQPIGKATSAFLFGLKKTARSFLGLLIFSIFFLFLTQPAVVLGSIGASLLFIAPVLLVAEERGAISACINALTLRYAQGKQGLRRYAFVQAVSMGMFLMAGYALFLIGIGSLKPLLDLWVPWAESLRSSLPFYAPYLMEMLLTSLGTTILAFTCAVGSTTLYFIINWVKRSPLQEQRV